MVNFYKKTLILSPHSDDEIFTLPFIYSSDNSFDEIDVLLIEKDIKRYKEAQLSCKKHGFNLLTLPANINPKGLFFYKNLEDIISYFCTLDNQYDLVLSPIIEGGHQDHDTISLAVLYCMDLFGSKTEIILYSTYRNIERLPFLYTCGLSENISKDLLLSFSIPKNTIFLFLSTILRCYRSQFLTWIFLLPVLSISFLKGDLNKYVNGNKINYKEAIKFIPSLPLYEIYRNITKKKWLEKHQFILK